ncbi:hypothetical protein LTR97_003825 [Elasticomyces elasticus]|uniref:Uncharacterized protein n=1 Tax=Elasticomyces elasticus TaxID=574655 RepID=A0AAN7VUJ9_9PEZI|nr:hypothetical protein LTR97_003825 [Elasticomyces elasticus]
MSSKDGSSHGRCHHCRADSAARSVSPELDSRLLELPPELMEIIVQNLAKDQGSLANLALVNLDCLRLVRPLQFASATISYYLPSWALCKKLTGEIVSSKTQEHSNLPSIGPYIRRLTVEAGEAWDVYKWEAEELAEKQIEAQFNLVTDEQDLFKLRERIEFNRTRDIFGPSFRAIVTDIVAGALPNLDVLDWKGQSDADENFFRALMHSSIQHLSLTGTTFEYPCALLPSLTPGFWSLKSLCLGVRPVHDQELYENPQSHAGIGYCTFSAGLLRLCAPTLESLEWIGGREVLYDGPVSVGCIVFPRLRRFKTDRFPIANDTLMSLLSAPLDEVEVGIYDDADLLVRLGRMGHSLRLRALSLPRLKSEDVPHAMSFLGRQTDLEKLFVAPCQPAIIERHIIPLIADGRFDKLTSLSLEWAGPDWNDNAPDKIVISEASATALASITSLEQLCLTLAFNREFSHEMSTDPSELFENHTTIKRLLLPLINLRKLALARPWSESLETGRTRDESRVPDERIEQIARARYALDQAMSWFDVTMRKIKIERKHQDGRSLYIAQCRREELAEMRRNYYGSATPSDSGTDFDGSEDGERDPDAYPDDESSSIFEAERLRSPCKAELDWLHSHGARPKAKAPAFPADQYDELPSEEIWELSHRNRMLDEAEDFARLMPTLKWLFLGQWPMKIHASGTAVPFTDTRVVGSYRFRRTFLEPMFSSGPTVPN